MVSGNGQAPFLPFPFLRPAHDASPAVPSTAVTTANMMPWTAVSNGLPKNVAAIVVTDHTIATKPAMKIDTKKTTTSRVAVGSRPGTATLPPYATVWERRSTRGCRPHLGFHGSNAAPGRTVGEMWSKWSCVISGPT